MKTLKAEIKQAANKQWFWHLKAGNNRIVLVSETYGSRWKCIRSMEMVRKMALPASISDATLNSRISRALAVAIHGAGRKS
jgi:uncharacterized protein YegP (UPF0339 family)